MTTHAPTRRILCIVGTRPEVVKMAPVLRALRARPDRFETRLLCTGQHRELLDPMLAAFGLVPDLDLAVMRPGQTLSGLTARVLEGLHPLLDSVKPDVVIGQGDTTSVMAAAMACFHARIPFAHVEAGLRTGDFDAPFPEEFNRRVAALAARYHFAPTPMAAANLVREGIPADRIDVTGNTVIDALQFIRSSTRPPPKPVPADRPYILMTCHRRESFGAPIREIFATVRDFARRHPELMIWYPVHPNPEVQGPAREWLSEEPNILLTAPLDYVSFVHALDGAWLALSDSGGVQEEAPALAKPVLLLRDVTERPEGVEAGGCLLVGPHRERIEAALERLWTDRAAYDHMARARHPYGDGHAGERIADRLQLS